MNPQAILLPRPLCRFKRKICQTVVMFSEIDKKFKLPARYQGSKTSIWAEFLQLGAQYNAVNLGLGFPDFRMSKEITNILAQVVRSDNSSLNQYTREEGHPRLVQAIAKLNCILLGRETNPETEILVTAGGWEALNSIILGHVQRGDEVIIIDPHFEYSGMVKVAEGVSRLVPLRMNDNYDGELPTSKDWVLDKQELENAFNSKTKMIILNSPLNPLGKVFCREELELIADLCKKWNVICLNDEVYEWIVYKPHEHIKMANLPGMWERTINVASGNKTFFVTGWRIGWAYGPANLMRNPRKVHRQIVNRNGTPCQEAMAIMIEKETARLGNDDCYFNSLGGNLLKKRDFLLNSLCEVGMKPTIPGGTFFIVADWTPLEAIADLSSETGKYKDYRFAKWMTKNVGVQATPLSALYSDENSACGERFLRFCFCKKDELLNKAADIMKTWRTKHR